jgi:type IV pilus assembly protein PilC
MAGAKRIDAVFVQAGVGGLASATTSWARVTRAGRSPRVAVVEPQGAACIMAALASGEPKTVSATEATNNRVYERALTAARDEVMRGDGLARPISDTGLFPGASGQMLRVGEESGTLDQQLELAADFYEQELDYKLKRLTSLFEPIVIVVMGLIVGFVAVALVSAMYGVLNGTKTSM